MSARPTPAATRIAPAGCPLATATTVTSEASRPARPAARSMPARTRSRLRASSAAESITLVHTSSQELSVVPRLHRNAPCHQPNSCPSALRDHRLAAGAPVLGAVREVPGAFAGRADARHLDLAEPDVPERRLGGAGEVQEQAPVPAMDSRAGRRPGIDRGGPVLPGLVVIRADRRTHGRHQPPGLAEPGV